MVEKIHRNSLKPGYKLHWYEIKKVLGQGGFGITYLAVDNNLQTSVAIKEYLPIEMAVREGDLSVHPVTENHSEQYEWGLDRFLREARTLAQFNHPNIVRVLAVFEENNTGYMVMSYEEGVSLADKLRNRRTLEEPLLMKLLVPLMGGLEKMHNEGFIHRDIKPDNIFIRKDGSPVLLDFGSARQALGGQTRTLTSLVTPGYAPFEQYYAKSDEQGPWTDIYGLGATLYRAVTGTAPTDAVDRSNALLKCKNDTYIPCTEFGQGKYSERFLMAIDRSLRFNVEDRPQSIAEWREDFALPDAPLGGASTDHIPTQPGTTFHSAGSEKPATARGPAAVAEKKTGVSRVLLVLVALLAIAGGAWYLKPQIEQEIDHWQVRQNVNELLDAAKLRLAEEKFTEPAGDNALETYRQVLSFHPENAEALLGLASVTEYLVGKAREAIKLENFDQANEILDEANLITPESANIRLASKDLEQARIDHEKRLAEESARSRLLENIVAEAMSAANEARVTKTLGLIEKARTLRASEETIANIKKHLYLALQMQIAVAATGAKLAVSNNDTKSARESLARAKDLKAKLENLNFPEPELTEAEQIENALNTARLAATHGYLDMSLEQLKTAKGLGAEQQLLESVKTQLRTGLEAEADKATKEVKLAMEKNDTQGARLALQRAKDIKAQLDKLN